MFQPTQRQIEASSAALERLTKPKPQTLVDMATGTGKTAAGSIVCAAKAAEGALGWWVVDRRTLVHQGADEVGKHQPQLRIAVEMGQRRWDGSGVDLIVGTKQSISRRLDSLPSPDYLIIDEAHKDCTDSEYDSIYDFAGDRQRLGLTATAFDALGRDMLIHKKWIDHCYRYSLIDAISEGSLCPIRAKMVELENVDLASISYDREKISKADIEKAEEQLLDQETLHKMALAIIDMPTPCLIFCISTKFSKELTKVLNRYDKESTIHLDCYMDEHEDGTALKGFRAGSIKRVCNYDLWGTGVDVPNCRSVVFCCEKNRVRYMQGLGRVSRWCCRARILSKGIECECGRQKTEGYVLDFGDNVTQYQAGIWSTLAPNASQNQLEEMARRSNSSSNRSASEIAAEVLADTPIIISAEIKELRAEEMDIANPLAELTDRARILGFAIPQVKKSDKRATLEQVDIIRNAFYYDFERRLRDSAWVEELGYKQAHELIRILNQRSEAGRAEPRLLVSLSKVKNQGGKQAIDRVSLRNMSQENALFHLDRHRALLAKKS